MNNADVCDLNDEGPATVGLIGFGAIARQLVAALDARELRFKALVRRNPEAFPANVTMLTTLEDLVCARPKVVIEVAGQGAVADFVPGLLESGIPVIIASVGALADSHLASRLSDASRASGAQLIIPAGAIGGIDYLNAISTLPDAKVFYTSRKPPRAWVSELTERGLCADENEVVLFEGAAREAALLYPKNLNAGMTLARAIGFDGLTVRVIADPNATGNTHEIEVNSSAGTATFRFVNTPSPNNPKTSALTALSLIASLRPFLNDQSAG